MFASRVDRREGPDRATRPDRGTLTLLAERVRPVSSSESRLLPVVPSLAGLLPDGGLRRGSSLVVTGVPGGDPEGAGSISLALALLAAASGAGSWCALVGVTGLGAVCAHDLGVDLDRSAVVPRPGPAWAEVTATLIDGVDLVLLRPPVPPRPAMARRLAAKARDRRTVLLVAPGRAGWPLPPDLRLEVAEVCWDGVGAGDGYLRGRQMRVTATGRRSAVRPRSAHLWLPSAAGTVEAAGTVAAGAVDEGGKGDR
jgi:hypothetical protein